MDAQSKENTDIITTQKRPITGCIISIEGDIMIVIAKDHVPSLIHVPTGERLGTFEGHKGTVWCGDLHYLGRLLITGSADNTLRLWDVKTGEELAKIETKSAVRACKFSVDGRSIMYSTDHAMGYPCYHRIVDVSELQQKGGDAKPRYEMEIGVKEKRITRLLWGPDSCFTAHANGDVVSWDIATKKPLGHVRAHTDTIMDLQFSSDYLFMITASKDHTAKLIDCETVEVVKTYETERPVNAACISPLLDHVILGGGQEASQVTTTHGGAGKFDARIFHMVLEEEIGRIKGHFGPINALTFFPDGKGYASGGEDGVVRVHRFEPIYFEYDEQVSANQ